MFFLNLNKIQTKRLSNHMSQYLIRTAIKLPHNLGVCQKTVGNSAGDFHGGGER